LFVDLEGDRVTLGKAGERPHDVEPQRPLRHGLNGPAARRGRQQLFINPATEVDGLLLNTSRAAIPKRSQ
jgi:hypothetical protein